MSKKIILTSGSKEEMEFHQKLLKKHISMLKNNQRKKQYDSIPNDEFRISVPDNIFQKLLKLNHNIEVNEGTVSYGDIKNIEEINAHRCQLKNIQGIEYFTALKTLVCSSNRLTKLDVSQNLALEKLHCSENQLTSLDVTKNTTLTSLSCSQNQLTSLDVTKNTALTSLSCSQNQLTSLDVTKNTALYYLFCNGNPLTCVVGVLPDAILEGAVICP